MAKDKLYLKITGICLILFLSVWVHAQPGNNAFRRFNNLSAFSLVDISRQTNLREVINDKQFALFVFLSPECPLCRNYTKTLKELREKFGEQVSFCGIVPGDAYTTNEVVAFETKYTTGFNLFIDSSQKLTRYLNASVTPQAILINKNGTVVYSGAIDDWVEALGKRKVRASRHYVSNAIQQSLQFEKVKMPVTTAIGCRINDY